MRSPGFRVQPWLYVLIGLLAGGGFGIILFRGFPANDPSALQPAEAQIQDDNGFTAPVGESVSFGVEVGALAPDFALEAVGGEEFRLSDYRGETVLLNFWATWCGPCLVEMPLLETEYQAYKDQGLHVLAVNDGESVEKVAQYGRENGLNFPLLLDPERVVQRLYQIRGYPSSVIVDEDGRVAFVHIGLMQESQLAGYLEALGFGP